MQCWKLYLILFKKKKKAQILVELGRCIYKLDNKWYWEMQAELCSDKYHTFLWVIIKCVCGVSVTDHHLLIFECKETLCRFHCTQISDYLFDFFFQLKCWKSFTCHWEKIHILELNRSRKKSSCPCLRSYGVLKIQRREVNEV